MCAYRQICALWMCAHQANKTMVIFSDLSLSLSICLVLPAFAHLWGHRLNFHDLYQIYERRYYTLSKAPHIGAPCPVSKVFVFLWVQIIKISNLIERSAKDWPSCCCCCTRAANANAHRLEMHTFFVWCDLIWFGVAQFNHGNIFGSKALMNIYEMSNSVRCSDSS